MFGQLESAVENLLLKVKTFDHPDGGIVCSSSTDNIHLITCKVMCCLYLQVHTHMHESNIIKIHMFYLCNDIDIASHVKKKYLELCLPQNAGDSVHLACFVAMVI